MKNKSVKWNTIINGFRMALTVIFPLITFPYVSRIFLTNGIGEIDFAKSVTQIFSLFASLGVYTYGVREGSKIRENREDFSHFALELLIINGISTIITYSVFVVSVFIIPQFRESAYILFIYSITIPFSALGLDWVYGVYEEYVYITIRAIIIQAFMIAAMFIFVHDENDLFIWALILVISTVGSNIFNVIKSRNYINFHIIKPIRLRHHIYPILVLFATQLASKVYSNLDTVLLGLFTTNHHTGLYSAAIKINNILITVFSAMFPVFVPKIMALLKNNRRSQYKEFIRKIFSLIIGLGLPMIVIIETYADQIIRIVAGSAFSDSVITLKILAPIILITSLANIFYYNILVPQNKEKMVLICTLFASLVNLLVSILLVNSFFENGVAIGSIVAESFSLVMVIVIAKKEVAFNTSYLPKVYSYVLGSVAIYVVGMVVKNGLFNNDIIHFLVAVLASGCSYIVVLALFKDQLYIDGKKMLLLALKKLLKM